MMTEAQLIQKRDLTKEDSSRDIPLGVAIEGVTSRLMREAKQHEQDSDTLATQDFWHGYIRGILEFQAALFNVQRAERARQTRQLLKLSRACHEYYRNQKY